MTGLHYSDGDSTVAGLLGTRLIEKTNHPRLFFTQQHGLNVIWEVVPADKGSESVDE